MLEEKRDPNKVVDSFPDDHSEEANETTQTVLFSFRYHASIAETRDELAEEEARPFTIGRRPQTVARQQERQTCR